MPEMKPYRQTLAEQETIIRWDREDPQVHLFSANPAIWRKLTRLGIEPVRRSTVQGEEAGRYYVFPVAVLGWGLKRARQPGRPGGNPEALARAREQRKQQGASPKPGEPGISA